MSCGVRCGSRAAHLLGIASISARSVRRASADGQIDRSRTWAAAGFRFFGFCDTAVSAVSGFTTLS
jgi:hypothetical protein